MQNWFTKFSVLIFTLLFFTGISEVLAYEPGENGTIRVINNSGLGKSNSSGYQVAGTSTAKVFGTSKGVSNITFNDPYVPGSTMKVWAGSFNGEVDGETAYFFCIDLKHPLAVYKTDDPNTYTDNGPTNPQITYVLNNYYPYVTYPYTGSLPTIEKEAAAIQLVIWHYADGMDLSSITDSELRNRAIQIQTITDANYSSFIPLETLIIIPPNQSNPVGTPGIFSVSTFDRNGNSLPNILVNLSATSGALSASSAVTDATGTTGTITLTQGASTSSVVTALANVKIPQGTMYVHSTKPNEKQKLVLATPAGLTRQVTSNVNWYTPEDCDTKGFTTFTQGGWGNKSNSTPGKIRDTYFSSVFPSGLVVGCGTYSITLTSAQAVEDYLPDGGTAAALTQNYTNPTVKINILAGQVTALKLNVMYDEEGYLGTNSTNLGDLVFASGTFADMSVYDFLALAENALGGCGTDGYSFAEINDAATSINENFDNGTVDNGYLTCEVPKASLGDKVWLDTDKDGTQDQGEAGIPDVTVSLYTCADVLVATTITDANGNYLFPNLNLGDYYVVFTIPTGYTITTQNAGSDDALDSDADVTGKTICTTLTSGENDLTWDAGIYPTPPIPASLGDKVWLDADKDGIQDSGENGVPNVTVTLYTCADVLVAPTTTDANGNYLFSNLAPGDYYVVFSSPSGYTITTINAGSDDAVDSDADALTGKAICTTLIAGENDLTWDAGIYLVECKNTIGDYVWHDSDLDGMQDENEVGIQGVVVELVQNNVVLKTSTTDASGKYQFIDVPNGTYIVRLAESNFANGGVLYSTDRVKWYASLVDQGTDDSKDSDGDRTTHTATVTVNCNDNLTIDFGFYKSCISLMKTASPAVVKPGEVITYTFTIENCGDIVLAGGVDVKDPLLNPVAPYVIEHFTLNPGAVKTFTKTYSAVAEDCGELINTATAEGHPADGSAYVTSQYSATVVVNCEETCVDNWSGFFTVEGSNNNSMAICKLEAGKVSVTGHVDLTPNPGKAYLQLTWRIVAPTDKGYDLGEHYNTFEISGSTDFTIEANWPGVECDDELVEVHFGVNVLDCDRNPIHNGIGFDYYWYPWVCEAPGCESADLELTKTADKVDAKNGDVITYTITVKNNGTSDATGVAVKDVIPVGVEYQSSSASAGSYDNTTGIWTIGNLASGATVTLAITVKVNVAQINNGTFNLGPATGYNVFVLNDITQPSSDTEGKMAVGRNASLGGYSVGDKLTPTSPAQDVLIVGGTLTYTSGRIYNGNVVVPNAASTNLPIYGVSIEEGELLYGTPIDFAAAEAYLKTLSTTLSGYTVNGTTVFEWGGLFLTGTNPFLNVFHVSGAELSVCNNFEIDVPNGSVVVVNIDGQTVAWMGGLVVKGTSRNNVLFNFFEAKTLTLHGIDVTGSILAPFAHLYFPAGVVNGQVIVYNMTGSGQFNNSLFVGNIPAETNIINIAEISASAVKDPDSTPNNGISTEDDYGKAIVVVSNDGSNSSQSIDEGSSNLMNWERIGNVASATVLAFTNDNDGNVITGTSNGKLYMTKDNGENWEAISTDTKAGAIWSLLRDNNGNLLAGTESGILASVDNGKTWNVSGLEMKDVRSIVTDAEGTLFAGVWGEGVYKSEDNGNTWNSINSGLLNTAVQSLLVNDNNEVFAATYGAGVSKFSDGTWTNTSVGNDYIWTLAKNSKGQVFAGTYGTGLYQLQNGGSWSKLENGLPAEYIYSITFDSNDKVYVSSLANGIFASENNGTNWTALGMGGKGVSTIIADKISNNVIAGTNDGNIYRSVAGVTDVKDNNNEIPTEYKLSQNYPNPFNPSTTIEFAVAKNEMVTLAVYDVLGQLVKVLVNSELGVGNYNVSLNASELTSGVYIYKLTTPSVSISKKMILQK